MKPIKKKQGFTIVELVIVIGVIGILAAILIPTFINLNNKAQVSSNQSFVKNLNTQMAIREQEEGKNNTMFEAVKDAKEIGFDVEKLTPVDNRDLVWDSRSDRFALLNSDGSVFFSEGKWELKAGDEHKIWKVFASMPTEQKFSIYAKEGWEGDTAVTDLQVGFDVGYNEGFTSISYVGKEGAAKTVTIRTNGVDTTLTVNNAADTVYHYGLVGSADILHTADGSYHEFEKAGFVQLASGRVVAEKGGYINTVVIVDKANSSDLTAVIENNGGVIDNAYATSAELIAANNDAARSVKLEAGNVISTDEINDIKDAAIGAVTPATVVDVTADNIASIFTPDQKLYRLVEDIEFNLLPVRIAPECDVTIDMNGHDITTQKGIEEFDYFIKKDDETFIENVSCLCNEGTLKLVGEGTVGGPKGWFGIYNKGSLILDGPSVRGGTIYFSDTGVTVPFDALANADGATVLAEGYVESASGNLYSRA